MAGTPRVDATTNDTVALQGNVAPTRPEAEAGEVEEAKAFSVAGYEILKELGRGGMGVVYQAKQTALDRIVALKMVLAGTHAGSEERLRFRIEAEAVARLTHPNIVQIYEVGQQDGLPYFSLEFMDGGSLEDLLKGQPLPPKRACDLVETLARAVHSAHVRGVVHRDLKPANILMTADGTPKIADFGLAKRLDSVGQTETGMVMGTPRYMAPEQAAGRSHEVGPAADIYALGVILYHLLTGNTPFNDENSLKLLTKVVKEEPPRLRQFAPGVPHDLETICLKCLEKSIEKRYASALDLAEDLRRFRNHEPIHARPITRLERTARWCRREPAWAGLIAVSLLAAVGLLMAGVWFHMRIQDQLQRTEQAHREALDLQGELRVSITRQAAAGVDSDLRQLAVAPQLLAELLGERRDWSELQLENAVRAWLGTDPRVFGMCIAFEPEQFQKNTPDFAYYVYRGPMGITQKSLAPPALMPIYREWDWYKLAQARPVWSEPYEDDGGGDVAMVTYSAPIFRTGKFAGVVTADLALAYFQSLSKRMECCEAGTDSYSIIVSKNGSIIYHPNPAFRFPSKRSRLGDLGIASEVTSKLHGNAGAVRGVDPISGKPADFLHAPIDAAGWTFITVAPVHGER